MSSGGILEKKVKDTIRSIPSILSRNRMLLAVIAFFYLLPLTTTAGTSPMRALLFLLTKIMIFGLLAMSFDLQLGRAALLNFGQVALFGTAAYVMAFTLTPAVLPFPFNLIAVVPYPLTILLAMLAGAGVGFIMGLTTSRMKGTAFAFIALAIAMFLYNFFAVSPDISGGETGLRVPSPALLRNAPFYMLFVILAFTVLAAFIGTIILYIKERRGSISLILFTPAMIAFVGLLLALGANIFGPILMMVAFLGMVFLYLMERKRAISDPLQYVEKMQSQSGETGATNRLADLILPLSIVIVALIGLSVAFGTNILQMISIWLEQTDTFYFTIPIQYYLVLTCLVVTYLFVRRLVASPFGRMVVAVAQNEERAEALGYNSYHCKIVVVVISGAIAGLAGGLYAPFIRTIDPVTALGVEVSINAMLYAIIGGLGTLLGPLLGAGVVVYSEMNLVEFVTEVLNLPGELWLVALGVIYVFIVLFMPLGIIGTIRSKARSLKEKLARLEVGRFRFGIKEVDYWVFAFLGVIGLILSMLILSL